MCGNIQQKMDQNFIKLTILYVETRNTLKIFSEAIILKKDFNIENMDNNALPLNFHGTVIKYIFTRAWSHWTIFSSFDE